MRDAPVRSTFVVATTAVEGTAPLLPPFIGARGRLRRCRLRRGRPSLAFQQGFTFLRAYARSGNEPKRLVVENLCARLDVDLMTMMTIRAPYSACVVVGGSVITERVVVTTQRTYDARRWLVRVTRVRARLR